MLRSSASLRSRQGVETEAGQGGCAQGSGHRAAPRWLPPLPPPPDSPDTPAVALSAFSLSLCTGPLEYFNQDSLLPLLQEAFRECLARDEPSPLL